MTPYRTAYEKYHERPPAIAWTSSLDFHLQFGLVISTPQVFAMFRRIPAWLDHEQANHLAHWHVKRGEPDAWHVWMAAGRLRDLLELAVDYGVHRVTFQRRDERLHVYDVDRLIRRAHL